MSVLNRKLVRELRQSTGVLVTIVAIIGVGVGSYVGYGSTERILLASQSAYYRDYRLADFWVDLKKAPLSAVERIADLPGIATLETRVTFDVILDLPGVIQPLSGRLLSAPERDFDKTINGICLIRGSGFSADRNEELILSESFAEAHGLEPGDRIDLILNRKRQTFVIVGTAISPEYVYMVRGQGDIIPDPEHFGILYIKDDYAREVLDFQDACNQIVGRLVPGAERDVEALLERIDRTLKPYGVLATTPRARQASNRFLSDEIEGLRITAAAMPVIFLAVAALVLNVLMTRMVERQRSVIGTLKAMGYGNGSVMGHYLMFGVVVGIAGGVVGIGLGIATAAGMVEMYKSFFQFPRFVWTIYPDLVSIGMAISIGFSVVGTIKGSWSVLKLEPAEAMRQKPPAKGGAIFLERFGRLWRQFNFRTHIALRSMFRNRFRTITGIICSALGTSIVMTSLVMYDSMAFLVEFQFERIAHQDVTIGMRDEKSRTAMNEARALPGVDSAEPVLGLRCDLRNGRRSRRLSITGLVHGHRLTTPTDADLQPIRIPAEGLVMSTTLANILDVSVGDQLELTPVRGRRDTRLVRLVSTVDNYLGLECYADLRYLSRLVGEAFAVNSVQMTLNPAKTDDLYSEVKKLPNAQGLGVIADAKDNIESTFVGAMLAMIGILIAFAGLVSFGSMLNNSLIEIGDRVRDISTFRVLGYNNRQIAGIFFRQNLITFVFGLAVAVPLGYWMMVGLATAYDSELFRMPVLVTLRTVLLTAAIAVVFVVIVQWFVYRQISKLDWLEGVKVME